MGIRDLFRRKKTAPPATGATAPEEQNVILAPIDDARPPGTEPRGDASASEAPARRRSARFALPGRKPAAPQENAGPMRIVPVDEGVVSIAGKEYAIGLTWVSIVDDEKLKAHAEIAQRVAANRKSASMELTLVVGGKPGDFYGFGATENGHKKGMPVLIESFNAEVMGVNWLAVMALDEKRDTWWVCGRRGGNVFEDRILKSRDAAAALMSDSLEAPGWSTIVAPEDWRIPRSVPTFPDAALGTPGGRLRHIDPIRVYGPRIAFFTIMLLIVAGTTLYFIDRHRKHLAEMEALRQQIERAITLVPQDFPWFHRTRIDHFIDHCSREIARIIVTPPGWENEVFTCRIERGRGTVSTGWRRAGGNVAWLRAAMPSDYPSVNVGVNAATATVTSSFQAPIDPDALNVEPWTRTMIENRLTERFQLRDIPLSMRFVADNRPPETNPLFHRHDIQVQGGMALEEIIPFIEDIPALIPDTLSYNIAASSWSLVLRIHHPVVLPELNR